MTRVRISFDVQLGALRMGQGEQISVAEIFCGNSSGGPYDGVWLFIEGPSQALVAHSDADRKQTALPSLGSHWTRVVMDARFAPSPGTVDITIGGAKAAPIALPTPCSMYKTFQAIVGLGTLGRVAARAFYDNLVYELDPPGP